MQQQQLELIASERGKPRLIYANAIYNLDRNYANRNECTWRCERKANCRARLRTVGATITVINGQHSHETVPDKIQVGYAIPELCINVASYLIVN
jgi:hypothetical protein